MSRNRTGGLVGNLEWGKKARKREDAQRGLNNRARKEVVEDQIESFIPAKSPWDEASDLMSDIVDLETP